MRIIVLSGCRAALPAISHLFKSNHLSALICPTEAIGTEVLPLQNWAEQNGLPCWQVSPESLETELSELITEITPDLILVYGFPYKVPDHLLQKVKQGGWNVHFSLQPSNLGTLTIHQLVEGSEEKLLHQQTISLTSVEEGGSLIYQLSLLSVPYLLSEIGKLKRDKYKKNFNSNLNFLA